MFTPLIAYRLSLAQIGIWLLIPVSIALVMVRSGGPDTIAGFGFLALVALALGGVGVIAGAVGLRFALRARAAIDAADAAREARSSVIANVALGGLQIVVFGVGFMMLTQLHH